MVLGGTSMSRNQDLIFCRAKQITDFYMKRNIFFDKVVWIKINFLFVNVLVLSNTTLL